MTIACPHCSAAVEVNTSGTFACWSCSGKFAIDAPEPPIAPAPRRATKERNWPTQMGAVVMMLLGALGLFSFSAIGFVAAIAFLAIGCWLDARCFMCSECGTTLNRRARICPSCRASFY